MDKTINNILSSFGFLEILICPSFANINGPQAYLSYVHRRRTIRQRRMEKKPHSICDIYLLIPVTLPTQLIIFAAMNYNQVQMAAKTVSTISGPNKNVTKENFICHFIDASIYFVRVWCNIYSDKYHTFNFSEKHQSHTHSNSSRKATFGIRRLHTTQFVKVARTDIQFVVDILLTPRAFGVLVVDFDGNINGNVARNFG